MIAFDKTELKPGKRAYCGFAGRRDGKDFFYYDEEICKKYAKQLKEVERVPEALSAAMGNRMFLATFPKKEQLDAFYVDVVKENK